MDNNIKNTKFFMESKKFDNSIKYKALKIWIMVVMVITLIYFLYQWINYKTHPVTKRQNFLRYNASAHPPSVFDRKYINVEHLVLH